MKSSGIIKRLVLIAGILIALLALLMTNRVNAQTTKHLTTKKMKLNAGIITPLLVETKTFYTRVFQFGVTYENDFYLLMHTPDHQTEISFLLPEHASQQALFQSAFQGKGVYLTIEVDDVDAEYKRIKALGISIEIALRDETWGDRHFAVKDPNGVGIDIVTYQKK